MSSGRSEQEVADAWATIMRQKDRELEEIRETRKLIEEILDELKPWQAKAIAQLLPSRYMDRWGNPKSGSVAP